MRCFGSVRYTDNGGCVCTRCDKRGNYVLFGACTVSYVVTGGIFGYKICGTRANSIRNHRYSADRRYNDFTDNTYFSIVCGTKHNILCDNALYGKIFKNMGFKNPYIRVVVGALAIIALTYLTGSRDYNGSGMDIIEHAVVGGHAKGWAWVLKIVFTAITIGAGFKGGEIVPTFFIGATFGCVVGHLFGLNPGFAAAIGMIAMFCGVLNCPIASIVLSIELFGSKGFILFAIAAGVSYMLSGYYGLYSSQKIMYSKLKAEYINKDTK